jgi:hypothetical protein
MYRDLTLVQLRDNWAFAVSAVVMLQAALAYVSPFAAVLTGIATVLSIAVFLKDAVDRRREARSQLVEQRRDPIAGVQPPSSWTDGQHHRVRDHVYLTSPTADRMLRDRSLVLEYSAVTHRLPAFMSNVVPAVVKYRRRSGSLIFNGSVLRLEREPATATVSGAPLVARPTRYFDVLATNYLCGHQVVSRDRRRVIATGWEFAVDRRGYLRDLEQSWSANPIGVSTVAFTTDRKVLLVQQSTGNVSERDRLAPSGSGSAEPQDVSRGPQLLTDVVTRAMERELREECNLGATVLRTRVVGYSRWVDHGGKPEFYGVTAVGLDERSLLDVEVARGERFLVSRVRTETIDVEALTSAALSNDIAGLESLIPGSMSTPLVMCLRTLGEVLREDAHLLDRLLADVSRG